MALLNALRNKRVYLDANVFIYALEGYAPFVSEPTGLFESLDRGEILREATRLRAQTNICLPDAIHLATALQSHCNVFLTNDRKLKCPSEVELLHLSAMVA